MLNAKANIDRQDLTATANWRTLSARPLSAENIDRLLTNEIPAIILPKIIQASDCERIVENLRAKGMGTYAHVSHAVGRLGLAQMEFHLKKSKSEYFEKVPEAVAAYQQAITGTGDPVMKLMSLLGHARENEVAIATENGFGKMFAGTFRNVMTVGHKHFDYAPIEANGWDISEIQNQLSWNLYLNENYEGGGLNVFNHVYQAEDEAFRISGQYYYSNELVENAERFSYRPRQGDIVIFNSRNIHEVLPVKGERFSLSSFIGEANDGRLLLWS